MPAKGLKVEFKIFNDKKLQRLFNQLPTKVQKKVIRAAMRKAMKLVRAYYAKTLPRDSGTAADALVIRAAAKRKRGAIAIEVRFQTEAVLANAHPGAGGAKMFYPAVIEYGSIKLNRPALHTGRKAYEEAGPAANALAMADIERGIQAEIRALSFS